MIRIFSGLGNMGGSTVAFINLVNLLNKNGHDTTFYAPLSSDNRQKPAWHLGRCKSEVIDACFKRTNVGTPRQAETVFTDPGFINKTVEEGDVLITHLFPLDSNSPGGPFEELDTSKLKKVIYACHETDLYPVTMLDASKFDTVQFVSEFQRDWHENQTVPSVVIPNVISPIEKQEKTLEFEKIAGVIGSVNPQKRTHVSIQAALDDGCDLVLLFGSQESAPNYWKEKVSPLVQDKRVFYMGILDDKALMYSDLDVVYHSGRNETFNYVEKECAMLDIPYIHTDIRSSTEENLGQFGKVPTIVSENEILKMWEKVFDEKRDS